MSEVRPVSPSAIKLFRTCPRRWNYRYIDGLKEPSSAAAEHGSMIHAMMEAYLLKGVTPTHKDALSLVPHSPRPLTALAERKVEWRPGSGAWSYLGIVDFSGVLLSLANMRMSPFLERGAPILFGDYKTTSNLKYALEVDMKRGILVDRETLEPDPQFAMYADYFYSRGYTDLTGKWNYVLTKGKTRTVPIVVRPNRQAVADVMGSVERDSAQIHKLYTIRPKSSQVRYNRGGCHSFNKPCPHLSYCELPRRSITIDDTEEGDDMGFADAMMSTFPGDPTDAPPIEGEEAPEIPEDMPDLPEEERGEMSEAEQLELIKAEMARLKAENGTTESGFVNPPEAPTVAPKNPEEAFERFGTPVVEKPKKEPARKFTAKDKAPLLAACVERGLAEKGAKFTVAGLAKLLRGAGVDPGDVVDAAEGAPALTILSQEGVTEVASALIDMEKFDAIGKELADLDEPPPPEDEGVVDQVEHDLTGDNLAALAEGMRLAADEMSKPTVVPAGNVGDGMSDMARAARDWDDASLHQKKTVPVTEPDTIIPEPECDFVAPPTLKANVTPEGTTYTIEDLRQLPTDFVRVFGNLSEYLEFQTPGACGTLSVVDAVRLARRIILAVEREMGVRIDL